MVTEIAGAESFSSEGVGLAQLEERQLQEEQELPALVRKLLKRWSQALSIRAWQEDEWSQIGTGKV